MLEWKPGKTRDAVLKIQQAIALYPREFDWEQCYYYVTNAEIAKEIGKEKQDVTIQDITTTLEALGLDLSKEVYGFGLQNEHTTGFFVSEKTLSRLKIPFPAWDAKITRNRMTLDSSRFR